MGHNDTPDRDLAQPRDKYPTAARDGFGDWVTDMFMWNVNHFTGLGNHWWAKTYSGPLNALKKDAEDTGSYWFRRLDHIGEREKRVNHLPLASMVDAERGAYNLNKKKLNYCNHLRYHVGMCEKWQNQHKDAHCEHAIHAYFSCEYNGVKINRMEAERMRRLGEAGVLEAIREKSKWRNKFPVVPKYQVIDYNRFRDDDNTWETYQKRKAAGEFYKNPQKMG